MPDVATNPSPAADPSPAPDAPRPVVPFPEGSRILHIGPPKTGTTALQAACWRANEALLEQGVRYVGGRQHSPVPARAVTGNPTITGNRKEVPSIRWWKALVAEMERAREPRLLYSSEALGEADDDAIRRIAADVGPAMHVLVTLRPIDAVLAGQWQQSVQSGSTLTLDAWVSRVLGPGSEGKFPRAERVFRQGELVERWAAVVGPSRVAVVILDRRDPDFLFRTAESLLAVRPGTLEAADDQANRSLSMPEVEVIRLMNAQAADAGMGHGARSAFITSGAAATVKRRPPYPGSAKVRLPAAAAARAVALGTETRATLLASGVQLLGDPGVLVPDAVAPGDDPGVDGPVWVDAETAATIAMGVAWGTGLKLGTVQPVGPRALPITFVPTRSLARQIVKRGVAWFSRSRKLAGLD